jgi:hypothetical protein
VFTGFPWTPSLLLNDYDNSINTEFLLNSGICDGEVIFVLTQFTTNGTLKIGVFYIGGSIGGVLGSKHPFRENRVKLTHFENGIPQPHHHHLKT